MPCLLRWRLLAAGDGAAVRSRARKKWLSEQKVDKQVVGGWLDMFAYEMPAQEGADWSRFLNEHMLKSVKQLDAFTPLATVPLQSGKLAAQILEEALDAGFHGAMVGTQPKGEGGALDDPDLEPFWEVASARKATLFVHPMFACGDDRLNDYDLVNAVGRSATRRMRSAGCFIPATSHVIRA